MTKRHDTLLKSWLVTLSLGVTVSGWALLARQQQKPTPTTPDTAPSTIQPVSVALPPIPTVEALRAYAASGSGTSTGIDNGLPPVPVVITPAPRPQNAPPPAAPQAPPPVTNTGSSK